MGYILPIQQHEYTDYQRRMFIKQRNIEPVKKTYKTTLQLTYEELKREKEIPEQAVVGSRQTEEDKKPTDQYMEEVFIQLTGLGRNINERI